MFETLNKKSRKIFPLSKFIISKYPIEKLFSVCHINTFPNHIRWNILTLGSFLFIIGFNEIVWEAYTSEWENFGFKQCAILILSSFMWRGRISKTMTKSIFIFCLFLKQATTHLKRSWINILGLTTYKNIVTEC